MASFLEVAPLSRLRTHTRFLLTLRSSNDTYHQLILFRLTSGTDPLLTRAYSADDEVPPRDVEGNKVEAEQLYAMEASCPHLGADMSHAEIEECETGIVAVCPWHRYDFDLKTGKSETGLKACTYTVQITPGVDGQDIVFVEAPENGNGWRLVELRPVSEDFADTPSNAKPPSDFPASPPQAAKAEEPVVPLENLPKTLIEWAVLILNTSHPTLKVERTRHAVHAFRTGQLASIGHRTSTAPKPPDVPPRDEAYLQSTVAPTQIKRSRKRAAMLHALANIEQWAIDLAWDIIARFGPSHSDLPPAFFSDWSKVALDESKHFSLLVSRLSDAGVAYGSMPVHAALWESARVTRASLRARLAIVHLVHEARGLDVNPGTIERFRRAGDAEAVRALEIIHADEVTHVAAGHRWFVWCCARDGVEPVPTFREEVKRNWVGDIKGPFNVEDRERAGLVPEFYEDLKGEMAGEREVVEFQGAKVAVGYDAT